MSNANTQLSKRGDQDPVKWLDREEVLRNTVDQLRKDLSITPDELRLPALGEGAFEQLRADVFEQLDGWQTQGSPMLSRAINRVDLTEKQVDAVMDRGGLHELAGAMVLRCLQKVLIRLRFAGRF